MYGLIHCSVRDLVAARYGEAAMQRVLADAGVTDEHFVTMQAYDDEITLGLIGAACETLDLDLADFLVDFGQYWVLETAVKHYGGVMIFGGRTLQTFLGNLDLMHMQVAATFTNLRQPSFEVESADDASISVIYKSERDGLTEFVRGLLLGLGQHFQQKVEISIVARKAEGAPHDIFRIDLG
ncbi:MAG: hypothetical protein ACI841_004666 [Planctomycetota bacterium]|jgi:hypothetical protein